MAIPATVSSLGSDAPTAIPRNSVVLRQSATTWSEQGFQVRGMTQVLDIIDVRVNALGGVPHHLGPNSSNHIIRYVNPAHDGLVINKFFKVRKK
jgi:hypothetical protein